VFELTSHAARQDEATWPWIFVHRSLDGWQDLGRILPFIK
jgi:hypothetical protein